MFAVHVVLIAGLGELAIHRPHLPRHALRLERPTRSTLLEELQAYRASRRRGTRVDATEEFGEVRYLSFHVPAERVRLTAHVGEVDEVAVDINVADSTDGVTLLIVVGELAAGAVEQDRVEDTSDNFVDLPAFHRQFERDSSCIHFAGVSGPTRECSPLLST